MEPHGVCAVFWYFRKIGKLRGLWRHTCHISHHSMWFHGNGFGGLTTPYYLNVGRSSLWCPFILHYVHHNSSCFSFPLARYYCCIITTSNHDCRWSWSILVLLSTTSIVASNFIDIYNSYDYMVTFFCVSGILLCGKNPIMNDSLCSTSDIRKVNLSIGTLNL